VTFAQRDFPMHVVSVRAARRFATESLADLPSELLSAVELMVSELATNSIRHAKSSFRITITREPGQVRVEVSDFAGGMPTLKSPGPDEPTGRGLRIVSLSSDTWGITQSAGPDKAVWFTVADPRERVPTAAPRGDRVQAPGPSTCRSAPPSPSPGGYEGRRRRESCRARTHSVRPRDRCARLLPQV
jgi:anti-sigma regulatory factor (Ser/Thr protein kinase)